MFQKPASTSYADSSVTTHDDVETVVGPSVQVEGDFVSEGNIVVKGVVSGSVKTSKVLRVEQGAKIFADTKAGSAIVSGEVKGNVTADDTVEVTSTARIMGDITCRTLVVEAGAIMHGKVMMEGLDMDMNRKEKKRTLGRTKMSKDEEVEAGDGIFESVQ